MHKVDPDRLEQILNAVAERTGVSISDMISRGVSGDRYRPEIRIARHVAYWTAYRGRAGSMAAIGARLGRSWHAVSHGIRIMDALRETDADVRRMTDDLRLQVAEKIKVEDIVCGSVCAGPDGTRWNVVRVDEDPDELQWVVAENERGGRIHFPRRDAAKWLRLV